MPFLNRQDIDPKVRKQFEGKYRQELRAALLNPALTAEQKEKIREKLSQLEKPRKQEES